MTYALPESYEEWLLSAPEDDAPSHAGLHRNPLLVEAPDVTIDAWGWYDGDGALENVQIGDLHIKPMNVEKALRLLGIDCPGWDRPLDGDTLSALSEDAAEADAHERAESRADFAGGDR